MRAMQRSKLFGNWGLLILGISAVGFLAAGWFLMARTQPASSASSSPGFFYRHCPECGFEVTCAPIEAEQEAYCQRCAKSGRKIRFDVFDYSHDTPRIL